MSAENNWIVANCTTPANYFHILRRQMHRTFRKPLIMMTPKSLLRHKLAVSTVADFTGDASFHRVLWDDAQQGNSDTKLVADKDIKRVVLCTGKVYYDLLAERDARGIDDVYLMRIEQLYPVPQKALLAELKRFQNADFVWCQEEPVNQGAWTFINPHLEQILSELGAKNPRPTYAGRAAGAAPATGLAAMHKSQQADLIDQALTLKGKK